MTSTNLKLNSADHAGDVLSVVSGLSIFCWASGTEVLDTLWRGRKKSNASAVSVQAADRDGQELKAKKLFVVCQSESFLT